MTETERKPEQKAADLALLRRRGEVFEWAMGAGNDAAKAEYRRRLERGETVLKAWRRGMWVAFHREHPDAN